MAVTVVEGVVSADVDLLDDYAALGLILAQDRGSDSVALRAVLDAVRHAETDVPLVFPAVDDRLATVAGDWAEIDADVGEVSRALRGADGGDEAKLALSLELSRLESERRHTDHPWDVDPELVKDRAYQLRNALVPLNAGAAGPKPLDDIVAALADLSGPEADAVLAQMTDEQLRQIYAAMVHLGPTVGWPVDRLRRFETMLGEKVSIETWRRLATFSPFIDPDPRAGQPDTASETPQDRAFFDSLRYRQVPGNLVTSYPGEPMFGVGDVRQGSTGDCYLIAAMQALALRDPTAFARMFKPNPNGTVTVTFADGSTEVVSTDLAVADTGQLAFARDRLQPGAPADLWPKLLEKAFAQRYGGWSIGGGGNQSDAIEKLTGRGADAIPASTSVVELAERMKRGEILGLSTIDAPNQQNAAEWERTQAPEPFRRPEMNRLVQNHAFVVTAVDPVAGTVTAINPWHPTEGSVTLTQDELRACVSRIEVNASP